MNQILSLFGILSASLLTAAMTTDYDFCVQLLQAHDFSSTDESVLITLVEQIKGETQIIITKFMSNESSSVHNHARYAAYLTKALDDNITKSSPLVDIAQIYSDGQRNSTTLALMFANLLDDILSKYGMAIGVRYDMTNMSNMAMVSVPGMDDSSSHSMGTALTVDQYNQYVLGEQLNSRETAWNTSEVVSIANYETAQVLCNIIVEKFTSQLRPRSLFNDTANVDKLENSLKDLKYAINEYALPEVVMEIVHVQIHPLLQKIYDLQTET